MLPKRVNKSSRQNKNKPATHEDMRMVNEDVRLVREDVRLVRKDVIVLRKNVRMLEKDMRGMKKDIRMLENNLTSTIGGFAKEIIDHIDSAVEIRTEELLGVSSDEIRHMKDKVYNHEERITALERHS